MGAPFLGDLEGMSLSDFGILVQKIFMIKPRVLINFGTELGDVLIEQDNRFRF
jgi:hypothetical protein